MGGQGGGSTLRSVEVYDPASNLWSIDPQMPTRRSSASTGVLKGKIYVIGGFSGSAYLNTVDEYNPETGVWRSRNPMSVTRSSAAAGVVNDAIYVI